MKHLKAAYRWITATQLRLIIWSLFLVYATVQIHSWLGKLGISELWRTVQFMIGVALYLFFSWKFGSRFVEEND